uniref:Ig-like domain-containing protein n=1 Tax=Sphaeramia orbicularis TaxID=375764 RepID=A0A672YE94_9TELE
TIQRPINLLMSISLVRMTNIPVVTLKSNWSEIFYSETVTLRCEIKDGGDTEWVYEWLTSGPELPQEQSQYLTIRVEFFSSRWYNCKGKHKVDENMETEWSDSMSLKAIFLLSLCMNTIYTGEKITLRCEIHRGDTEWEYEWRKSDSALSETESEIRITEAHSDHTGDYSCRGKMKQSQDRSTNWSDKVTLTVTVGKPSSVLTVSPSWLSPGASVTLKCHVKPPSAGWRFYWYKAVPQLSDEPEGTEQENDDHSQITVSPGGTYQCRGGRGDPVYYSNYSNSVGKNKAHCLSIQYSVHLCEIQDGGNTGWTYEWTLDTINRPTTSEYRITRATTAHRGSYRCRGRTDSSDTTVWSNVIKLTVAGKMKPVLFIRLFITL